MTSLAMVPPLTFSSSGSCSSKRISTFQRCAATSFVLSGKEKVLYLYSCLWLLPLQIPCEVWVSKQALLAGAELLELSDFRSRGILDVAAIVAFKIGDTPCTFFLVSLFWRLIFTCSGYWDFVVAWLTFDLLVWLTMAAWKCGWALRTGAAQWTPKWALVVLLAQFCATVICALPSTLEGVPFLPYVFKRTVQFPHLEKFPRESGSLA